MNNPGAITFLGAVRGSDLADLPGDPPALVIDNP